MHVLAKYKQFLGPIIVILTILCYFGWSYLDKQADQSSADEVKQNEKPEFTEETKRAVAEPQLIFVDISGGVVNPGLYALEKNKRLADLLQLAGGLSKYADTLWVTQKLNLAQPLKDSEKIYIPFASDREPEYLAKPLNLVCPEIAEVADTTTEFVSDSSSEEKLNVNTATKNQLMDLPGIGQVTADKIMANRPYADLADFYSKTKIGTATKEKINNLIVVE